MRKIKIFPIFLILLLVISCSSFVKVSYITLNESKDLYNLAMEAVADLQNRGLITPEKRAEINQAAKIYKEAHNSAVDALAVYKITKSSQDKDKVIIAMAEAAQRWNQLAKLINAIKPGLVPESFTK